MVSVANSEDHAVDLDIEVPEESRLVLVAAEWKERTLLSGDLNFALDNLASYVPVIQEGRIRALAVTSAERWPTLPEVPTMAEAGVADFVVTSWCTIAYPAGVPRPIMDRLNAAIRQVAEEPGFQQRFLQVGARALWSTPEAAAEQAARQRPMWRDLVQLTGARIE